MIQASTPCGLNENDRSAIATIASDYQLVDNFPHARSGLRDSCRFQSFMLHVNLAGQGHHPIIRRDMNITAARGGIDVQCTFYLDCDIRISNSICNATASAGHGRDT